MGRDIWSMVYLRYPQFRAKSQNPVIQRDLNSWLCPKWYLATIIPIACWMRARTHTHTRLVKGIARCYGGLGNHDLRRTCLFLFWRRLCGGDVGLFESFWRRSRRSWMRALFRVVVFNGWAFDFGARFLGLSGVWVVRESLAVGCWWVGFEVGLFNSRGSTCITKLMR